MCCNGDVQYTCTCTWYMQYKYAIRTCTNMTGPIRYSILKGFNIRVVYKYSTSTGMEGTSTEYQRGGIHGWIPRARVGGLLVRSTRYCEKYRSIGGDHKARSPVLVTVQESVYTCTTSEGYLYQYLLVLYEYRYRYTGYCICRKEGQKRKCDRSGERRSITNKRRREPR